MFVNVTRPMLAVGLYGLPLGLIAVVPAKINCDDVGFVNAEYQTSAY